MSATRNISITVSNAADGLSNAVDLGDEDFTGILMPAAWTAAGITFLVAPTLNGTYGSAYDDGGTELTVASANVVTGRSIMFGSALFEKLRGIRFLKLRSGTAGAAVQQGAARVLTILAVRH